MFITVLSGYCGEIVKNGQAVIQGIVIPDDKYYSSVEDAAKEFSYHLKKSTGIDIPIIKENLSKPDGKYIYLGNCRKSRSVGITPANYSTNAGVILIDKNNVYIVGNDGVGKRNSRTSLGTLFSTYSFLEKYLGARWLWPGALGEVIPSHKNIVLQECKENITPKLSSSRWRAGVGKDGWSSKENREKYYKETRIWLDRHRFWFDPKYNFPHAFTEYFKRFGKSNPEFFNLLPDGTRRSNPYSWNRGADKYISMCVTSPGLIKQIIRDWQAKSPRSSIINLNENDSTGDCVCEDCLTADNSPIPNKIRREKAAGKFLAKKKAWVKELGSVSDRYCKFYLNVQNAADKINPEHLIAGLIYANYSEPPSKEIKLNNRIILRFCPPFMFPWTDKKVSDYKRIWKGWGKTGAQLMLRPNFTFIQCFPIMYQDVFYDLFNFSYNNGMSITDMDCLTGHYGVHGPVNYVIASLNHDRDSSLQTLEDDYFSAFGAAKKPVKQYFELMKKISMRQDFNSYTETIEGGSTFYNFFLHADVLFTPKVMEQANDILNRAASIPGLAPEAKERVEFLRIALKHAQMLMDTQAAFRKYKKNGDVKEFKEKLLKLYRFRASIEDIGAVNVGMCHRWEYIFWPRQLLREALKGARVASRK
jgi:hypothetical protein